MPLTYRVVSRQDILVRSGLRKELEDLATFHYGVFVNLAKCHELLRADGEAFARSELYNFYSRLFSVDETAEKFLARVKVILRRYGGVCIPDLRRRLNVHGKPGLASRFEEAKARTNIYRNEQVHACAFVTVGSKIPRREYLSSWTSLGELDRLRRGANPTQRLATEFVEGLVQAGEDLTYAEGVLNDLWDMALRELEGMTKKDQYRADQRAETTAQGPGAGGTIQQFNVSSQSASGTFAPPQGPQGQL